MDLPSRKPLSKEETEKRLDELRELYKKAPESERKLLKIRGILLKKSLVNKPMV